MRLSALDQSAGRRELRVEALWPHKGMLVLKFAGVDSISDAELLVGSELQVPREQRAQLEPGWTYISDLVGCTVFDTDFQGNDREVGTVENVQFGAGEAPLLVVRAGARQYEIPYAQAYLKGVDLGQKRIEMLLPEGILEVNDSLTAEEKRDQNEGDLRKRKFAGKKNRTSSGG
jgi:16S rRNA processing protein RimM